MLVAGLVAALVSILLQPVVINALRRHHVLDVPGGRSSHAVPTPRGGGIAVVLGVVVGASSFALHPPAVWMLLAVVLAAGVGLVEDVVGISVVPRLLLLGAAVAPVLASTEPVRPIALVISVAGFAFVLAVVNAVNFMDGINGITAAVGVAAGAAYAMLAARQDNPGAAAVGAAVAGASIGFAPYNVPRARVFLGDCGSYGVGAALAGLAFALWAGGLTIEGAVAPLALYLVDTGTTLLRRIHQRESWHLPHRTHVYQRLTDAGWSHSRVSGLVLALVAACAGLGAVTGGGALLRAVADFAILLVLCGYLALPRLLDRRAGSCAS